MFEGCGTQSVPGTLNMQLSGPLEVRNGLGGVGGGRGVYATAPIRTGTLVMREVPVLTLPKSPPTATDDPASHLHDESLHMALARSLVQLDDHQGRRAKVLEAVALLYPQHLSDLPAPVLEQLRAELEGKDDVMQRTVQAMMIFQIIHR